MGVIGHDHVFETLKHENGMSLLPQLNQVLGIILKTLI